MRARQVLPPALGVFLLLSAGTPVRAQVCTSTCSNYVQGQCVEYTQRCETPPPPQPGYGAIAYGRTSRAWGNSYHWDSRAKAESVAMSNCAQRAQDCEVMVWFEFKCGAVVSGAGTTAFWGLGDGIGAARGDALNKCKKAGSKVCDLQVSECSR